MCSMAMHNICVMSLIHVTYNLNPFTCHQLRHITCIIPGNTGDLKAIELTTTRNAPHFPACLGCTNHRYIHDVHFASKTITSG